MSVKLANAAAGQASSKGALEARHPCLEVQDDLKFMANDIQMDKGSCIFV
jgi:DNA mismatch repair ATPase MutS